MRVFHNLRLPLCPKCGNTKHVERATEFLVVGFPTSHLCRSCQISWNERGICEGFDGHLKQTIELGGVS